MVALVSLETTVWMVERDAMDKMDVLPLMVATVSTALVVLLEETAAPALMAEQAWTVSMDTMVSTA